MKTTAQEVKAVIGAFRQNNANGVYSFNITSKKVSIAITSSKTGEAIAVYRAELLNGEWVGGYTDEALI